MMFGSVAGWLRIARPPHWLQSSCQELLRRGGLRKPRVGAWRIPCHWPLSHQHKHGLQDLASAARGEPHFCRGAWVALGCGDSLSPCTGLCPVFSWSLRLQNEENSTGRLEQALGCCVPTGSGRNRASSQTWVDAPSSGPLTALGTGYRGTL